LLEAAELRAHDFDGACRADTAVPRVFLPDHRDFFQGHAERLAEANVLYGGHMFRREDLIRIAAALAVGFRRQQAQTDVKPYRVFAQTRLARIPK
jgi:hypothetical protein